MKGKRELKKMQLSYGQFRKPRQMLGTQEYDGHLSIHDDKMAGDLGFTGAPIEGPTHFSQFVPLLHGLFGDAWFERGCISAHYQNMVVAGESVRAFVEEVSEGAMIARIGAEKEDGTPVLTGTASVGPDYGETEIDSRMSRLRPSEQLVILSDLEVGQLGAGNPEHVRMDFDQNMGAMYPFSLADKLKVITEDHPYYRASEDGSSPWDRAIVPMEMISVLTQYTSDASGYKSRGPASWSVCWAGDQVYQGADICQSPVHIGTRNYRVERE